MALAAGVVWRKHGVAGLVAGFMVGAGLGLQAGQVARAACVWTLDAGSPVRVVGIVASDIGTTDHGLGSRRLTLNRASVLGPGGRCAIGRLVARVRSGVDEPLLAGTRVDLTGRWQPMRRPSPWPAPPHSAGYLSGGHVGARTAPVAPSVLLRLRTLASRRLRARVAADALPVSRALLLAERDDLTPELRRTYAAAGLVHLLAISGLHIGLLAVGLTQLAGLWHRRTRHAQAAIVIWIYVASIGLPASAVRAAILFTLYAAARATGRPRSLLDSVGYAFCGLVLVSPAGLLSPGLQLSFAGFLGLIAGGAVGQRFAGARAIAGRRLLERWCVGLGAAIGAFAATGPIAAAHFEQIAPAALIGHVVATPVVGLALWALVGVILLPPPLSTAFAGAAALLVRTLNRLASILAAVPFGHADTVAPGWVEWVAIGLVLIAVHRFLTARRLTSLAIPLGAAIALLLAAPTIHRIQRDAHTLLCTLDVGQGDATVLRTRSGHWLVFDAGPAHAGQKTVVPFLKRRGARVVDLFTLSHPDLDHLGGAVSVFSTFPVRRVLDAGVAHARQPYLEFLDLVEASGARWLPARVRSSLRVDEVTLYVLGPVRRMDTAGRRPDANAMSVAFVLEVAGGFRYVNTGDASVAEERDILETGSAGAVRAEVLKIGHHGSRSSSSREWLTQVAPTVAVVSAGAGNRYGHPHSAVLENLSETGVPHVWRTDIDGSLCVVIERDGSWRWGRPGAGYEPGFRRR